VSQTMKSKLIHLTQVLTCTYAAWAIGGVHLAMLVTSGLIAVTMTGPLANR
jgi:hypothetical protein